MTHDEWLTEGLALFGNDRMAWKFKCPSCGNVASTQDYKDAGASSTDVGFACVGRWLATHKEAFDDTDKRKIPCNYASGGLINLNSVDVDGQKVFEFGA